MSHTVKQLPKVQESEIPICDFSRDKCIKYDFVLKYALCQTHANKYRESVRCRWLPPCFPKGRHVAVLRGGRLHV
jgi:hypothetical protein